jgi:hypothetical protein
MPNPAFERDWPIYIRFAACGLSTFGASAKFGAGQPLNLNVRGGVVRRVVSGVGKLKHRGYGKHRRPSRPLLFWPCGHRRRWRVSKVASAGFLSVAASRFPGKVAPQPFATTAVLTGRSSSAVARQAGWLRRAFLPVAVSRFVA